VPRLRGLALKIANGAYLLCSKQFVTTQVHPSQYEYRKASIYAGDNRVYGVHRQISFAIGEHRHRRTLFGRDVLDGSKSFCSQKLACEIAWRNADGGAGDQSNLSDLRARFSRSRLRKKGSSTQGGRAEKESASAQFLFTGKVHVCAPIERLRLRVLCVFASKLA